MKEYISPEIEEIKYQSEDVLTISGGDDNEQTDITGILPG